MKQPEFNRRDFNKGALGFLAALGLGILGCDEREDKPTLQDTLMEDTTTLKDFPYMLAKDGNFNGYLIVGDTAPASDVVAAVDIATGMQSAGINPGTNFTKLASEVATLDKHAILIGRLYDNPLIQSGDVPALATGEGYLGLEKQNGLYRLIVSGADSIDIRKAGRILAEHCQDSTKYDLNGKKVIVTGTTLTDLGTRVLE